MSARLSEDDTFVLATVLDDWLDMSVPGDDETSQSRYAHIERLRDLLGAAEAPPSEANPAACPECRSTDQVQAQGWVFARYVLEIDERGGLDFPQGAECEWDLCKPYDEPPPGVPNEAEYLYCTACSLGYWYLNATERQPGRFLQRASN